MRIFSFSTVRMEGAGPSQRVGMILLGLFLWGAVAVPGRGQAPRQVPGTEFREATALGVDPGGRLYVADAGCDVIRILSPDGALLETLGGPGTRAGEFYGPQDLDPTNGQMLYVADAGNGRIQQFSAERQYLGALTVGAGTDRNLRQRAFDDGRNGADVQGTGRPIAVASSDGDDTFVVDAQRAVVVRFDVQGRVDRLIGPAGRLDEPVALAIDGSRRLYVADRGREAVLTYDLLGTFVERLDTPPLPDVRALTVHRGRLWIVCPERVIVWNPSTETSVAHAVDLPAPLVDVARRGDDLFLLTAERLYRRAPW